MKKFFISFLYCIGFFFKVCGQIPYTEELFDFRIDTNITYGNAINYAGNFVDLKCDIYKPVGDNNSSRPILVLVHGGAWISGSKNEAEIQTLAQHFAKRGYVVSALNYRLGMHPSSGGGSNTITCTLVTPQANCVYVADSSEVVRAIYRGMQDIKGAIRFMKGRSAADSTCAENTYLAGVSAGGFCALAAAFLDVESEKPASAYAIEDAEQGAPSLNYCHNFFNNYGAAISRLRPDLGDIQGDIALNGETAEVKGIANFYGGMLVNLFEQYQQESPLLYLFHQTTDVVVNCGRAPILSSFSYDCLTPFGFLGCNQIWNMPWSHGSCSIVNLLNQNVEPVQIQNAIINNGTPNCLMQPPGHSILNFMLRVDEITNFFGERILTVEQSNCENSVGILKNEPTVKIFPNPGFERLQLTFDLVPARVELADLQGRVLINKATNQKEMSFDTSFLSKGLYLLNCYTSEGKKSTFKWQHN
jgi:hypothetical protein